MTRDRMTPKEARALALRVTSACPSCGARLDATVRSSELIPKALRHRVGLHPDPEGRPCPCCGDRLVPDDIELLAWLRQRSWRIRGIEDTEMDMQDCSVGDLEVWARELLEEIRS